MPDISTQYGRIIDDLLAKHDPTSVEDGLVAASNAFDNAEKLVGKSFATGETDEELQNLALQLTGQRQKKDKDGKLINYSLNELQSIAQNKYERTQRSFFSFQQLRQRAHEMMMDIIKAIGR